MKKTPYFHIITLFAFLLNSFGPIYPVSLAQAQVYSPASEDLRLPAPGVMVHLSPEFTPAHLQGLVIHPENALQFDFLINRGDNRLTDEQKQKEYNKLIKYFLASLTVPDDDQWVNLSPYEKDRIIKDDFGKTEMGRDLLGQDYILKQITSSLIYPESSLGKEFWNRVYTRAFKEYGATTIPVNTFNKVWIIPDEAAVYESGNTVYILRNHLKVMLEEDYLSLKKHAGITSSAAASHSIGSQVIREIVLPELEKEVNTGKNFANLRQIYSGMILATWYKHELKESLLGKVYADRSKTKGVDQDPKTNLLIYQRYLKAFKKGVFNFVKEDVDKYTNEMIPRKYFSGGAEDFASVAVGSHDFKPRELEEYTPETGIPANLRSRIGDPAETSDIDSVNTSLDQAQSINNVNTALTTVQISELKALLESTSVTAQNITEEGKEHAYYVRLIAGYFIFTNGPTIEIHGPGINYERDVPGLTPEQLLNWKEILDTVIKQESLKNAAMTSKRGPKKETDDEGVVISKKILDITQKLNKFHSLSGAGELLDSLTKFQDHLDDYLRNESRSDIKPILDRILKALPETRGETGGLNDRLLSGELSNFARNISNLTPDRGGENRAMTTKVPGSTSEVSREINTALNELGTLPSSAERNEAMAVLKVFADQAMTTSGRNNPRMRYIMGVSAAFFFAVTYKSMNMLKNAPANSQKTFLAISFVSIMIFGVLALSAILGPRKVRNFDNEARRLILEISKDQDYITKNLFRMAKVNSNWTTESDLDVTNFLETFNNLVIGYMDGAELETRSLQDLLQRSQRILNSLKVIEERRRAEAAKASAAARTASASKNAIERASLIKQSPLEKLSDQYVKLKGRLSVLVRSKKSNVIEFPGPKNGEDKAQASNFTRGGIDLNSANLNLMIKRDGKGVPLPLALQDMAQLSHIQGFVPEIIEIKPAVNLPIISELQQKLQSASG